MAIRLDMIKHASDGYHVMSADGTKHLGGPYATEAEAVKRLAQVEGHKNDAAWDTAYINGLPDSSFLHVSPGGSKDADGKTVPRSLRHFPYKDASGAVDLPHLRNALARIPQSDVPDKQALTTKAEKLLQSATRGDSAERVARCDRGVLRSPRRDGKGRMRVDGVFTRAGVFEYRRADGTIQRELRPDSEVFSDQALKSLEMIPVVNDHPRSGLLGSGSAGAQGWTLEGVRRDGDLVVGSLLVTDPGLIASIESGKTSLSVGYEVAYDPTPGSDPTYGRYDGVQRAIRGDHLAVVDVGRAGPEARVRMDALGTNPALSATSVPSDLTRQHVSDTLTGKDINSMDELKKTREDLAVAIARAEAAEKSVKELAARADAAAGKAETLEAELVKAREAAKAAEGIETLRADVAVVTAKLDAERKLRLDAEDPKRFAAAVIARASLEQNARIILGDKFRADLDDRTLMVASVEKIYGAIENRDQRSDDYVRARFDAAALAYVSTERALHTNAVDKVVEASKVERVDSRTARQRMIDDNNTLKPLSAIK